MVAEMPEDYKSETSGTPFTKLGRAGATYVISKEHVMSGYNLEKIQTYKRLVG